MKRRLMTTAAALVGLGLFGGCAGTNTTSCGERQGLFARWFGRHNATDCPCVETGNVLDEGPVIPDPGCCGTPTAPPTTPVYPTAPVYPTTPPPSALPTPNPLAQPAPANPSSQTKDVGK